MKLVRRWGPLVAVAIAVGVFVLVQARDPVREQFEDRATLPSCGSVVLDQGQALRRDAVSGVACLRRGLVSGEGAELEVESPTVEGDPIRTYYRVLPDGSTEVYDDSTEDAFGSGEWSFASCSSPASVLDVNC